MVQFIQAQDVTIAYLKEKFGLQLCDDEQFFTEWFENLPELTDLEKQYLDRVKANYLSLVENAPLLENAVKLVVLAPLLDLAGFYRSPFSINTENSVEISAEDEGEIIRDRIDVLVVTKHLWVLVIESKRASFSLLEAIPQSLAYMLANPQLNRPTFGLAMNGEDFRFIKLTKSATPMYGMSDKFTLLKRGNELYQVLSILKKLGQIISN